MAPRRWHSVVGTVVFTGSLFLGSAGGGIAAADPDSSTATDGADSSVSRQADDSDVAVGVGTAVDARITDDNGATDADAHDDAVGPHESYTSDSSAQPPVDDTSPVSASDADPAATSPQPSSDATTPLTVSSPAAEPASAPAPAPESVTAASEPAASPPPPAVDTAPVTTSLAGSPAMAPAPTSVPPPPPPVAPPPVVYPVLLPPEYIWMLTNLVNPAVAIVERLMQVPGDLYQALVSLLGTQPPTPGLPNVTVGGGLPPGMASLLNSPLALLLLSNLDRNTGPAAGNGSLGMPGVTGALSLYGYPHGVVGAFVDPTEPPSMVAGAAVPTGRSWLDHAIERIDDIAVPASLAMLAATALPGIGGILILTAVGIRLGYRQARAGVVVRVSAVARFLDAEVHGVGCASPVVAFRRWPLRAVPPDEALDSALRAA